MRTTIFAIATLSVVSGVTWRAKDAHEPRIVWAVPSRKPACTDHLIENPGLLPAEISLDCGDDREISLLRMAARSREEFEICADRNERPRCFISGWRPVR